MELLNQWDCSKFVQYFGSVVELCPLAASSVWGDRPFRDVDHIVICFSEFLFNSNQQTQDGVLRLHPELGGHRNTALSIHSESEQRQVGLLQISETDRIAIRELNAKYRQLTGFPFIICVLEGSNDLKTIVNELQLRLNVLSSENPVPQSLVDEERGRAIRAVSQIAEKRIRKVVDDIQKEFAV